VRLGIVGTGRAAWFFGNGWKKSGRKLSGIVMREGSSSPVPALLDVERVDDATLVSQSDVIVIAVRDSAISATVPAIAAAPASSRCSVFHCSGALPAAILSPLPRRFSLHPLRALPAPGLESGGPTLFAYEGPGDLASVASEVVDALGGSMFHVAPEAKTLYHAAAAMAANYVALLAEEATRMFERAGIVGKEAREAVALVAASALDTWKDGSGVEAFSGPIARGEVEVVRRHLEALRGSSVFDLYLELGKSLARTMRSLEPENPDYKEIATLLGIAPRG
jgi:predicted short-subunit dehydrogenase-like oxidoreductase (DUF2520 family)